MSGSRDHYRDERRDECEGKILSLASAIAMRRWMHTEVYFNTGGGSKRCFS